MIRTLRSGVKEIDTRAGQRHELLPLLSVSQTMGAIRYSEIFDKEPRANALNNYKVALREDLIINRMSADKGAVGVAKEPGLVSPDYAVLRCGEQHSPTYISYLMKSASGLSEIKKVLRGIGTGSSGNVRTPRLSTWDLLRIKWFLPGVESQTRIADFLDRETAEIDAFIADQEHLFNLLKLRFDAQISEQFRCIKASSKLKFFAKLVTGVTPSEKVRHEDFTGFPWIRPGDIAIDQREIIASLHLDEMATDTPPLIPGDSPFIVGIGATIGNTGFSAHPFTTNQQLTSAIPRNIDPVFLYYVLRNSKQWIISNSSGTTLPLINNSTLGNLPVPILPLEEQRSVSKYLDLAMEELRDLQKEISLSIELSKERRSALISAAVTGQIDVSDRYAAEKVYEEVESST